MENQIETSVEKSGLRSALIVAATSMIAFMGIGLVDPILNTIAQQLSATPTETTLLFTSYMMVTGIVMLFTSFISSRLGLKATLMLGLLIIVIFSALGGMSNSISALIGLRAIWGFGNALFISTALSTIVSVLVGNTEKAIMMYEAAIGAGMAVGPLLGGSLGSMSWRFPFFGVATLITLAIITLTILLPTIEKPAKKAEFWAGAKALTNHKLRSVGLIALLYNFGFFTLLAYAPFLLSSYSEMQVGFVFFGWGVLLALSSIFVAPVIEQKINTFRSVLLGLFLFATCLLMIGLGTVVPILVPLGIILAGFFQGTVNTLLTTIAMEIPGIERNTASSAYSFVRFFGGSLAPVIAGLIGEHLGNNWAFYFAGTIVLLSLIFVVRHQQYFATKEEFE